MRNYRVYCNGYELGLSYTRDEALAVVAAYRPHWPGRRYYCRRVA